MLTGSLVSSLQGEPRSIHDIDIVTTVPGNAVKDLVAAFKATEFCHDVGSIEHAIRSGSVFNLLDTRDADKMDFWALLAKLRWSSLSGGSKKHVVDALRVYEVRGNKLETAYLETWISRLGLESLRSRLVHEVEV